MQGKGGEQGSPKGKMIQAITYASTYIKFSKGGEKKKGKPTPLPPLHPRSTYLEQLNHGQLSYSDSQYTYVPLVVTFHLFDMLKLLNILHVYTARSTTYQITV